MADPQYSRGSVIFHWLTVAAIVAMVGIGWYMTGLPKGPDRSWWYGLHKSLGLTVSLLILARIAWRIATPPPTFPVEWTPLTKQAAEWGHRLIYVLLVLVPIAGYLTSAYTKFDVKFWGIALPRLVPEDQSMNEFWKLAHNIACYTLLVVVAGHAIAGLRHLSRGYRRMFGFPEPRPPRNTVQHPA